MLDRLRGVEWIGDWDYTMGHMMSRRLLMREYLRRAALWAQAYSAEDEWPFFDVTEHIDPEFRLSPEIAAALDEFLGTVPEWFLRDTCAGAVRMAELRLQNQAGLPDLPDLYEPLVLFYERGGEFLYDNGGGLDLTGVSFRPKGLQHNLGSASSSPSAVTYSMLWTPVDASPSTPRVMGRGPSSGAACCGAASGTTRCSARICAGRRRTGSLSPRKRLRKQAGCGSTTARRPSSSRRRWPALPVERTGRDLDPEADSLETVAAILSDEQWALWPWLEHRPGIDGARLTLVCRE